MVLFWLFYLELKILGEIHTLTMLCAYLVSHGCVGWILKAELEMFASSKSQPQVLNLRDRYLGTTTDDSSLQFQRRYIDLNLQRISHGIAVWRILVT